jgi:DNA uptake protein ComE-like DNA-binding protein
MFRAAGYGLHGGASAVVGRTRGKCFGFMKSMAWAVMACVLLSEPTVVIGADTGEVAAGLSSFTGCTYVATAWADGDSFQVRFPDGALRTLRLYGADCIEWHVNDESDARRLRAQRRYFGLVEASEVSIATARNFGRLAADRIQVLLQQPFVVHTAFADGRGDARFQRVYAFVETADGDDGASVLVREGLARAFGVYRRTPCGASADEYREQLMDLELTAAMARRGVWSKTDWAQLPAERRAQREEDAEVALAVRKAVSVPMSVDPNAASHDELTSLPGVGPSLADRIIAGRAGGRYTKPSDLDRVTGIGPKAVERLAPFLKFP